MGKVTNNPWRRRQVVKSPPFHGGIAGSNPAGVTNSLLTFYLSLHYGWRLTLKSQYESLLEQMKKHYWGRTNMTYKWKLLSSFHISPKVSGFSLKAAAYSSVAQSVVQEIVNLKVGGSSPSTGANMRS